MVWRFTCAVDASYWVLLQVATGSVSELTSERNLCVFLQVLLQFLEVHVFLGGKRGGDGRIDAPQVHPGCGCVVPGLFPGRTAASRQQDTRSSPWPTEQHREAAALVQLISNSPLDRPRPPTTNWGVASKHAWLDRWTTWLRCACADQSYWTTSCKVPAGQSPVQSRREQTLISIHVLLMTEEAFQYFLYFNTNKNLLWVDCPFILWKNLHFCEAVWKLQRKCIKNM